ncbi:hypothetical protein ES319_D12G078900v1 [Gossypium barbadense]|uniref:non-specific serine/threonine protein kinase n=2 Tax=Gossypium TaxID=3633 RepID=A0A5J5NW94_GOSBA|nr:hypothetical protein ES319_D12G078900v1 [Gossypium barbadense]TYG40312.1 hypothetical protein ES288_D12G083000v1 [Gossypium darwinii]
MDSQILPFIIFLIAVTVTPLLSSAAPATPCQSNCGSLQIKYPFGTGYGCGSPRFEPYITCKSNQLLLTTHTGSYLITAISYKDSTLTITPSAMSTCNSMQQSPNLGLDWASPFQLGPSIFLLLSCTPPTSSLTIKGSPVCDPSSTHLCATIYTCPAVVNLRLPLFPPTNTCCVYSPANFNSKGELDLREMKCKGYASIGSFQDSPTDPSKWMYGVTLKYTNGGFDDYYMNNKCNTCEDSGGICGYSPPTNSFLCICNSGFNATTDCYNNYNPVQDYEDLIGTSTSLSTQKIMLGLWVGQLFYIAA